MAYIFSKTERIDGVMIENQSEIKVQRKPYKLYLKEIYPNTGVEVLYPHPADETKALINPNGFPWMNLKLDPNGELMRKDQHHTILEGGYDYVVSIMDYYFYKYRENLDELIVNEGSQMVDGRMCNVVSITNADFGYHKYIVKKGESLSSIALKNRLNEYMIAQNNDGLGLLKGISEGQELLLSSDYCQRMILYIDQDRQIPLKMEVYDDKGIFERYEFLGVKINPDFTTAEFTMSHDAYNF
jgi:hypothetical protein